MNHPITSTLPENESNNANNSTAQPNSTTPHSSAQVGDTIQLGRLDWIVLSVRDNRALLLSYYILEIRPYHNIHHVEITWEYSNLRKHLNGYFLDTTFDEQERALIIETLVINNDHPRHRTPGGNDTLDKVFLLSIDEMDEFMGNEAPIALRNARIAEQIERGRVLRWWLRSPGIFTNIIGSNPERRSAYAVNTNGNMGSLSATETGVGVRPALWLYID